MDASVHRIKQIKERYEKKWLSQRGVVSVGIGGLSTGGIGIIVGYTENFAHLDKHIPRQIDNVRIELRKTEEIKAL